MKRFPCVRIRDVEEEQQAGGMSTASFAKKRSLAFLDGSIQSPYIQQLYASFLKEYEFCRKVIIQISYKR